MEKTETRRMVRFLATDINGELPVAGALRKIPGISFMLANAVLYKTGVDGKKKIGNTADEDLKKLEAFVKGLGKGDKEMPSWLLNRRKDAESGNDLHAYGSELDLKKREDISVMKRMRSYRGIRHEFGLPVRGQRTRSSFRTQKTVGVTKKKILQAQAAAAKPKEEKK